MPLGHKTPEEHKLVRILGGARKTGHRPTFKVVEDKDRRSAGALFQGKLLLRHGLARKIGQGGTPTHIDTVDQEMLTEIGLNRCLIQDRPLHPITKGAVIHLIHEQDAAPAFLACRDQIRRKIAKLGLKEMGLRIANLRLDRQRPAQTTEAQQPRDQPSPNAYNHPIHWHTPSLSVDGLSIHRNRYANGTNLSTDRGGPGYPAGSPSSASPRD